MTNNLAKLAPKKAKSIELGKEEAELDADLKALVPANFKTQKKLSDSDFAEVVDAKKILDDMGLGTKSRGLNAGDFSGHGSSSYQEEPYESPVDDIFAILATPDCSPFYMTEIHGCKYAKILLCLNPRHFLLHRISERRPDYLLGRSVNIHVIFGRHLRLERCRRQQIRW